MNMLTCNLNRMSEVPLYEQLYSHIKKEIIDGRLLSARSCHRSEN